MKRSAAGNSACRAPSARRGETGLQRRIGRWRERDSNCWSHPGFIDAALGALHPPPTDFFVCQQGWDQSCRGPAADEAGLIRPVGRLAMKTSVGPAVRIPFPPAESQVRTCLSREFAFPSREGAVFRGCVWAGAGGVVKRRAGHGSIAPTSGNISVGPHSSTAPPVMWAA